MKTHDELTHLVEKYKTLTSHKERASLEETIWVKFYASRSTASGEKKPLRRQVLAELLGVPQSSIDLRSQFFHCDPPVADLIWDLLDNKSLPLHTAVKTLRTAVRRSRTNGEPLFNSLAGLISSMNPKDNSHGHTVHLSTGRVFFRKNRGSLKPDDPPLVKDSPKDPEILNSNETTNDPNVWMSIRKLLSQDIERRMSGMDKTVSDALWHDIDIELKVFIDSLQSKIYRVKRREVSGQGATIAALSRAKIMYACRTLHMDPPDKHGKPIDMQFARRMKRKLGALYHPDNHGGSDAERPRYEAVMQAYDILEQYMSTLEERGN